MKDQVSGDASADANSPANMFRPTKPLGAHGNAGSRLSKLIIKKKGRTHKL